ncbi:hypothetical protein GDO86_012552, partial [Hymenochirus boettgeri]
VLIHLYLLLQLRKPVIEKMRRDRINSSIEQLRMLLEKEFENHHLPSKPEKADILEMTVRFLQQHMAGQSGETVSHSYEEGYSKCVKDSLHFLSAQDLNQQGNLLKRFQSHSRPSQQQKMVP